ncbi:MAG: carbamoyltransferase [Candidatus Micrarchaeota archaeon]|nr:MAG: carbamoyltransferase [Candidatus Micrarchaeota archaeon]
MILGIHDCHDAGAALIDNGKIVAAVNEERFTKRKNDVGFPYNSIKYLVDLVGIDAIDKVAVAWIGGSALFARVYPKREEYRRALWRREIPKPSLLNMKLTNLVFRLIQEQKPRELWHLLGEHIGGYFISKRLKALGIDKPIEFVEHHIAHAASAYYASGFKEALVITLDGAGDGLSGSISIGDNGELKRINSFRAGASLGILYGAATLALDMRYSEDEGKTMCLAAYSYPYEIKELEKISRFDESKRQLVSDFGIKYELYLAEYFKNNILWYTNREAFAYAVQKHLENQILKIVNLYVKETGIKNIAVAGGVFSNIIVNMLINELPYIKNFFVFPHMGDGGLAVGAAYYVDYKDNKKFNSKQIEHLYYGASYSNNNIEDVLKKYKKDKKIAYEEIADPASYAADLLRDNKIILWFQGAMEYGPRALGNRSILALPNDNRNRELVNLKIKKRPYYQPFASSILDEDADKLLDPYPRPNRFMTVGYHIKEEHYQDLIAASHIDKTTRPQILQNENKLYRELLLKVRKITGYGALFNTSLNKHGKPIVMDPEDALWTLLNTDAEDLIIGNFYVKKL